MKPRMRSPKLSAVFEVVCREVIFSVVLAVVQTGTVDTPVPASGVFHTSRVMFPPVPMTCSARFRASLPPPLLAMMVMMGLYPKPFLDRMEKSVTATLARAEAKRVADDARFRADRMTLDARTVAVKTETSVVAQP